MASSSCERPSINNYNHFETKKDSDADDDQKNSE